MNYNRMGRRELSAIKSDGTVANPDPVTGLVTFPSTGTWYMELGEGEAPLVAAIVDVAVHLQWNAAFAATITFEWTNFPAKYGSTPNVGPTDIASNDSSAAGWVQDNDATGDKLSATVGTGNTITNLTIVAGGTNAGGVGVQLKERSARRYRLKLVVTAVGTLRVIAQGKIAA